MHSRFTCSSSPRWLTTLVVLACVGSACSLTGIDPDEIDIADDGADEVGGTESGDTAADGVSTSAGDGDGDSSDSGEATGTADPSDVTGASDGTGDLTDTTTGDVNACEVIGELFVAENAVESPDTPSLLVGECGGSGGEATYSFLAPVAGDYTFAIDSSEIPAVAYAVDAQCVAIPDACALGASSFVLTLEALELVLVVVDSDGGSGAATLTITGP